MNGSATITCREDRSFDAVPNCIGKYAVPCSETSQIQTASQCKSSFNTHRRFEHSVCLLHEEHERVNSKSKIYLNGIAYKSKCIRRKYIVHNSICYYHLLGLLLADYGNIYARRTDFFRSQSVTT